MDRNLPGLINFFFINGFCRTLESCCFSDDNFTDFYNANDGGVSPNDRSATVVVTSLVLILWLFSIYRLYRVWSVKLNFSGVSEKVT